MDTILSWALLILLGIFIFQDRKKDKDYKDSKKYTYNQKTKSFDAVSHDPNLPQRHTPVQNETKEKGVEHTVADQDDFQNSFSEAYYAKELLTANELRAYAKLKQQADERSLVICPKVRLADIVHPREGDPNYFSHFGRIKSKHVDFVICNQLMIVLGIVELDDNSHNRRDRQQRDQLVDAILTSVGYKIIHTREITPNLLDRFL